MKRLNKLLSHHQVLDNERGVAIVSALLVLMLLTFVSASSTDTTISEQAMVRSDANYTQTFYIAEAGLLEKTQLLLNSSSVSGKAMLAKRQKDGDPHADLLQSDDNPYKPVVDNEEKSDQEDVEALAKMLKEGDPSKGISSGVSPTPLSNDASSLLNAQDTKITIFQNTPAGTSLRRNSGRSSVFAYTAYSYSDANDAATLLKLGFRMRF